MHRATIRNWVRAGLPLLDQAKPQLVRGTELYAWVKKRRADKKRKCAANEMYCLKCRMPRTALAGSTSIIARNVRSLLVKGQCVTCGTKMNRAGSMLMKANFEKLFGTQTSLNPRLTGGDLPLLNWDLEKEKVDGQL